MCPACSRHMVNENVVWFGDDFEDVTVSAASAAAGKGGDPDAATVFVGSARQHDTLQECMTQVLDTTRKTQAVLEAEQVKMSMCVDAFFSAWHESIDALKHAVITRQANEIYTLQKFLSCTGDGIEVSLGNFTALRTAATMDDGGDKSTKARSALVKLGKSRTVWKPIMAPDALKFCEKSWTFNGTNVGMQLPAYVNSEKARMLASTYEDWQSAVDSIRSSVESERVVEAGVHARVASVWFSSFCNDPGFYTAKTWTAFLEAVDFSLDMSPVAFAHVIQGIAHGCSRGGPLPREVCEQVVGALKRGCMYLPESGNVSVETALAMCRIIETLAAVKFNDALGMLAVEVASCFASNPAVLQAAAQAFVCVARGCVVSAVGAISSYGERICALLGSGNQPLVLSLCCVIDTPIIREVAKKWDAKFLERLLDTIAKDVMLPLKHVEMDGLKTLQELHCTVIVTFTKLAAETGLSRAVAECLGRNDFMTFVLRTLSALLLNEENRHVHVCGCQLLSCAINDMPAVTARKAISLVMDIMGAYGRRAGCYPGAFVAKVLSGWFLEMVNGASGECALLPQWRETLTSQSAFCEDAMRCVLFGIAIDVEWVPTAQQFETACLSVNRTDVVAHGAFVYALKHMHVTNKFSECLTMATGRTLETAVVNLSEASKGPVSMVLSGVKREAVQLLSILSKNFPTSAASACIFDSVKVVEAVIEWSNGMDLPAAAEFFVAWAGDRSRLVSSETFTKLVNACMKTPTTDAWRIAGFRLFQVLAGSKSSPPNVALFKQFCTSSLTKCEISSSVATSALECIYSTTSLVLDDALLLDAYWHDGLPSLVVKAGVADENTWRIGFRTLLSLANRASGSKCEWITCTVTQILEKALTASDQQRACVVTGCLKLLKHALVAPDLQCMANLNSLVLVGLNKYPRHVDLHEAISEMILATVRKHLARLHRNLSFVEVLLKSILRMLDLHVDHSLIAENCCRSAIFILAVLRLMFPERSAEGLSAQRLNTMFQTDSIPIKPRLCEAHGMNDWAIEYILSLKVKESV